MTACTAAEYRAAYNYTVSYLRDVGGVHSAVFAYAPSKPSEHAVASGYDDAHAGGPGSNYSAISRYPGDGVVDVVCFDRYDDDANAFTHGLLADCGLAARFAARHGKVLALCEFGWADGLGKADPADADRFYMESFLTPVGTSDACRRVAWALTWRNSDPDSYWVSLPGQPAFSSL